MTEIVKSKVHNEKEKSDISKPIDEIHKRSIHMTLSSHTR